MQKNERSTMWTIISVVGFIIFMAIYLLVANFGYQYEDMMFMNQQYEQDTLMCQKLKEVSENIFTDEVGLDYSTLHRDDVEYKEDYNSFLNKTITYYVKPTYQSKIFFDKKYQGVLKYKSYGRKLISNQIGRTEEPDLENYIRNNTPSMLNIILFSTCIVLAFLLVFGILFIIISWIMYLIDTRDRDDYIYYRYCR